MWKLPPIVCEIVDQKAMILFEVYNLSSIVSYRIENKKTEVLLEPFGPTYVVMAFNTPGIHIVQWIINDVLQYQHQVNLSPINKLIFVSCDLLEADTKHSLWNTMKFELFGNTFGNSGVQDPNIAIIHLGDQAYMDPVFNQCKKILRQNPNNLAFKHLNRTQVEDLPLPQVADLPLQQCFYLYSQRYCDTWRPHADILSNVSNYYLWDDHEITNNIRLDNINDNLVKTIANIAIDAYRLYQQPYINHNIINEYCWYKYINEETVIVTIERVSRHIALDEIFKAILSLEMKKLILCFSSAPIPHPQGAYGDLYKSLFGLDKFWQTDQLKILYEWLFGWMSVDKQVIVVGGDLHFGVHGQLFKDKLCIPVIIASPITNQPSIDRKIAAKGLRGQHVIGDMVFNTITSKARRCYATLDLDHMLVKMIYSQDKYPKNKLKYLKKVLEF